MALSKLRWVIRKLVRCYNDELGDGSFLSFGNRYNQYHEVTGSTPHKNKIFIIDTWYPAKKIKKMVFKKKILNPI